MTKFVVLSSFAKRSLLSFGIPEDKIFVKPNFAFRMKPFKGLRPRRILYSSRLELEKGTLDVLNGWVSSSAGKNGWNLKIAGDGSQRDKVKQYSEKNSDIQYLGKLDKQKLSIELSRARFSIFSSRMMENSPMSIIESLGASTPIIASSNLSTSEYLDEEFSINISDYSNSWSDTFNLLDHFDANKLSVSANIEFEKKYSPEIAIRNLESLYRGVI